MNDGPEVGVERTQQPRTVSSLAAVGDLVLAVAILGMIQAELWVTRGETMDLDARVMASVVSVAAAAPIAFRNRAPVTGFWVNTLAIAMLVTLGFETNVYQWTNLIMVYTLAAASPLPVALSGLAAALTGVAYYFVMIQPELKLGDGTLSTVAAAVVVAAVWIVGWLGGLLAGIRREESVLRAERDLATEVAATRQERLQLEEQRASMARDLHDLIGHTVNVMVVHAGAGRGAVRNDPDTAEQAFRTIEQTGRSALDELDRLLGVLRRDDPAPTAPAPGLADLVELVDGFSKPPLEATLAVSGPTATVPAGVGLTVFRVTQEALTNVLKHAGATAAEVSLTVDDREVALTIDDNGTGNGAAGQRPGNRTGPHGGRGLAGITERVKLHGGSTDLGPRPSGGFRVDCRIPLRVVV